MYGGGVYGEILYGGGAGSVVVDPAAPAYPTRSTTVPYSLEVRTKGGQFLEYVPAFDRGLWTEEENKAGKLDLDIPMLDSAAQYLTKPNKLYLFDHRYYLQQVFWITNDETADSDSAKQTVEAASLIIQLRDEPVEDYVTPEPNPTVRSVLIALLAMQKRSNKIRLGTIASVIGNQTIQLEVTGRSILYAITKIAEIVGGSYWVDQFGRLNWKAVRGYSRGVRLEFGFNLLSVNRRRNTDNQVTRLRMLGKLKEDGSGERVSVMDAGEPSEWLEDGTAISNYDKISRQIVDNEISDANTLKTAAELYLANHKDPIISYDLNAADMSQADQTGRDEWFKLGVGDSTPVIDLRMIPPLNTLMKVNTRTIDLVNTLAGSSLSMATRQDTLDTLLSKLRSEQKTLAVNGVPADMTAERIIERITQLSPGDPDLVALIKKLLEEVLLGGDARDAFYNAVKNVLRDVMEVRGPHVTDVDLTAVDDRLNLASSHDKYVERFYEGMTCQTQDTEWSYSWVGNPSDHDTTPGYWVKHVAIHRAADKASLPHPTGPLANILDGDLAVTDDFRHWERVDGEWYRKTFMETHADSLTELRLLLPAGNEKFRGWIGAQEDNDHLYIYSDDAGFTSKLVPLSHGESHS